MGMRKELIHELKHHLPFTALAAIIGIVFVLAIKYLFNLNFEREAFEILHPLHILASGAVSAGIFYLYRKNKFQAAMVGIISAIIIGTLSDVLFPFFGGMFLGLKPEFHLPILQTPLIILVSALIGSLIGIGTKMTKLPHTMHVFLSVFASLFYLLAFTSGLNFIYLSISIITITLAVIIPCCVSDILLPFFFLGKDIKACGCSHGKC